MPAPGGKDFLQARSAPPGDRAARATNQTSEQQLLHRRWGKSGDADYSAKSRRLYALGVDPFVAPEHPPLSTRAPRSIPSNLSPRDRMQRKLLDQAGSAALRSPAWSRYSARSSRAGEPAVPAAGTEKVNRMVLCTGPTCSNCSAPSAQESTGPPNGFAEVVEPALFAKLSGGRPGQPAQLVVAIHCRWQTQIILAGLLGLTELVLRLPTLRQPHAKRSRPVELDKPQRRFITPRPPDLQLPAAGGVAAPARRQT